MVITYQTVLRTLQILTHLIFVTTLMRWILPLFHRIMNLKFWETMCMLFLA